MHRQIYRITPKESEPEMPLTHSLVIHLSGNFREPVVKSAINNQNWGHAHHHMEMRYNEIGVGQGQINHDIPQK